MFGAVTVEGEDLEPPPHLLERLRQLDGYSWDESREPFHSSYDIWHIFGTKHYGRSGQSSLPTSPRSEGATPLYDLNTPSRTRQVGNDHDKELESGASADLEVVARISIHSLRDERVYNICKNLMSTVDPNGRHVVRPVDIMRLAARPGDEGPIVVCVFEYAGPNYLPKVVDYGPAWYPVTIRENKLHRIKNVKFVAEKMSLQTFLDFAIGAAECLEILHGQQIVHGEVRADAFHMNKDTGQIKLINLGAGLRTFEHSLTSTGWSAMSKDLGAVTKLSFMSPEQTGRMSIEPDSRTDIFSLGVLLWTILMNKPAFEGETPMDIIQAVLGQRLALVSNVRLDIPEVVGRIVQKATAKTIFERYHSASGLRHDLIEVRRLLGTGDSARLLNWEIATKDVSPFFILPKLVVGRAVEHDTIVKIIDSAFRQHRAQKKQDKVSTNHLSRLSEGRFANFDSPISVEDVAFEEDNASSSDGRKGFLALSEEGLGDHITHKANTSKLRSLPDSQRNSIDSSGNDFQEFDPKSPEKGLSKTVDPVSAEGHTGVSSGPRSSSGSAESVALHRSYGSFRATGRCEVITIAGSAGLGKSRLIQSVQVEARQRGYFASSKFHQTEKTPLGPVLRLLSSLFQQFFSESNMDSGFHKALNQHVGPLWPILHKVLGLPESLLSSKLPIRATSQSQKLSRGYNRSLGLEAGRRDSSPASSQSSINSKTIGAQSSQNFLRVGSSTKSLPLINAFLDVLRLFARHKLICFCLDDLHFADEESLDLIAQIVSSKIKIVFILAYKTEGALSDAMKTVLDTFINEGKTSHQKPGLLQVTFLFLVRHFHTFCLVNFFYGKVLTLTAQRSIISLGDKHALSADLPNATNASSSLVAWNYISKFANTNLENSKSSEIRVTTITLRPLNENDIMEYVATTLRRPKSDVFPLGLVIQSTTAGNPFYIKEMLAACHRRKCLWYDYLEGEWTYDLDRVFKHFKTENYNDTIRDDFVTSRLAELPSASRSILAWASLLGSSFSFQMILLLLNGEFTTENHGQGPGDTIRSPLAYPEKDCVKGLQAAIQAYIILPSENDDIFRFAHDRYMSASASLRTDDEKVMNFVLAQTLLKHYSFDERYRAIAASSICQSVETIRNSVARRRPFRRFLLDLAHTACESGVRSAALKLYVGCIALLQDDMWNDEIDDVSYEETLQLYTEAAECFIYRGQYSDAKSLLLSVASKAKTAVDMAPSWILQSRLLAQEGNSTGAFEALKRCLVALNVKVDNESTFAKCDAEFKRLCQELQRADMESLVKKPMIDDSNLAAIGAVLVEATSAAFWSDTLTFYQMTLIMVDTHLSCGSFPQSGMGFLQLALIAVTRHNMINFASDCGNIALALIEGWKDPFTIGRGGTIYSTFLGHLQHPLRESIMQMENALDFAIQAGDRISTILNFGLMGNLKYFASENLVELESFCTYGCQDIPNWETDTPGGTMVITIRQACRALQGKTFTWNPLGVMSDEQHNSSQYKSWLLHTVKNSDRPLMLYESIEIAPLFLYGHFASAVALGNSCLKKMNAIWSARNTRYLMFFQALSLAGSIWIRVQEQLDPVYRAQSPELSSDVNGRSFDAGLQEEIAGLAMLMKYFKRRIEQWQAVTDVNYLAWSKILGAQIAEMEDDHTGSLRLSEEALDHASKHNFVFEEALANSLLGAHLLRIGSRRLARTAFRDAITLYRRIGASGVASHIEAEHSLLLRVSGLNPVTTDVGIQTDLEDKPRVFHGIENAEFSTLDRSVANKVGSWQEESAIIDVDAIPALHMLDLTSILKSSQVISSVLKVDQLLKTMCEIILQNCKGVASSAAIVIEEEDSWVIAASGDPEEGAQAHNPTLQLRGSAFIAESVVNYCTRFRETILLPDLMLDNRFSNVSETWIARNPASKSVVALPICHGDDGKPLLGVLYLEGQPNAFSTRNLEILQLLVNQIGISYSNALTLKEVERVSAINKSMVDVQKKALSEAIVAENNANIAKAEALRNAKLAEEAAQAKTTFLANISHELRTPLNGVIGNSELLIDSRLEKQQAEMADSIRVSADLLLSLINDILDFSKIEAHKMELHLVAFNANEMVGEVVRSMPIDKRHRKSSKDIHILQDINLPQALVFGDPVRLHQILGNLVSNSLKFTEKGTITIGARTEWETDNAVRLSFWAKDTGIGISTATLHKLFKPFSQADASTARKYGGSGLGLSICKSLVESMGGTIELESTENVGTTVSFSLTLPKVDSEVSAGGFRNESSDISATEHFATSGFTDLSSVPSDQLRICIAEDNPINQRIAIQFLEKLKFKHVDAYDNGLEAVEGIQLKAREGRPYHMVLMDVQMPVLDGYEATKLLRKDPLEVVRGILVIALTASAVQGDREKCLASGMNDYLAKPVRLAVLKKKFGQYMHII